MSEMLRSRYFFEGRLGTNFIPGEKIGLMIVHVKRAIRLALGGIFLLLGIAGLLLPILQGWFFLGLAVFTLSRDFRFLAKLESRLASRFPKVGHFFERLRRAIPLWD